jgi:LPXTG-motif cell wall-anchored protein
MKGIYARHGGSLVSILGLMILTLNANGISQAAVLNGGAHMPAQQTSDLPEGMAGVTWQLESMQIVPPQVSYPLQSGIVISVQFDGQGNLSGSGACNSYFAGYTVGPDQAITIGPIGSTQKACAEDLMNLDREYFVLLQRASKYSIFQGHLSLTTENGTGILNYISSTPPAAPGMPTTGDSRQPLLVLFGLALGLCLAAVGMVFNYRRREYRAIRIRIKK